MSAWGERWARWMRSSLTICGMAWLSGSASLAAAAPEGELCGRAGPWAVSCDPGLRCDIHWKLRGIRIGVCTRDARACGGLLGTPCETGEFCDYPVEAICGAADQTGLCQPLPTACTRIFAPVCGCDGRDYGNRCEANAAGVAVASEGACAARCGDGGALVCDAEPSPCAVPGEVREVVGGCYGNCVDPETCRPTTCEYDGDTFQPGETFIDIGGCKTCGCALDASHVACGMQCSCRYDDPNFRWVSRDPVACQTLDFRCEEGENQFANFCGCGCFTRVPL